MLVVMKKILLYYIMGKYRLFLIIISVVISLIFIISQYFIYDDEFYFPSLLIYSLLPMPLIVVLYNVPGIGAPSVNEKSSDLDIFLRYIYLIGALLPLFLALYFTFYPEVLFEY